jgi:hypothetical protein
MTSASIPVVTTLRSSLSMYVFYVWNKTVLLFACFVNSSLEVTFRIYIAIYNIVTCQPIVIFRPVGEPRKRRRDRRHLAAQRRQKKEQKRTQRKDGCQKNMVAARRAAVAWRRINVFRKILTHRYCGLRKEVTAARVRITRCAGHRRKRQNKDDAERETRKGRKEENRRRKGPQCKTRIKNPTMNNIEGWDPGERAPLGRGGTRKKDICDIFRKKIMEHGVGTSSGLRTRKKWALWRGRPLPKRKKKQH